MAQISPYSERNSPMIILVINCGSSSIKYQLYRMPQKEVLAKGLVEKIGEEMSRINHTANGNKQVLELPIKSHKEGMSHLVKALTDPKIGVIRDMSEIGAVGHRLVHGGEAYSNSVLIDDKVIACVQECADLAPLHNPPNLIGVREARALLPKVPMVGVFDTAFHQTLPEKAFLYALPYDLYRKYRVRRYGFHGTSHAYVSGRAAKLLNKPLEQTNLITCHLGNGCSMTAVRNGKSVDTTMGLTPLEGLVMGTRSGDIDPAIIFYLAGKEEYRDLKTVDSLLNKKSGLLGISGFSNDQRNLEEAIQGGGEKGTRAKLAIDVFNYRLKKYIGAYMAALGRVDAIVFTGGIGENGYRTREAALSDMEAFNIIIDKEKNRETIRGKEGDVSAAKSAVRVLVVPTDEEGFIATDTYNICSKL